MEKVTKGCLTGIVLAAMFGMGGMVGKCSSDHINKPKKIIPTIDLDGNGIKDMYYLNANRDKIPMFGFKNSDGKIIYYTAQELKKNYNDILLEMNKPKK